MYNIVLEHAWWSTFPFSSCIKRRVDLLAVVKPLVIDRIAQTLEVCKPCLVLIDNDQHVPITVLTGISTGTRTIEDDLSRGFSLADGVANHGYDFCPLLF